MGIPLSRSDLGSPEPCQLRFDVVVADGGTQATVIGCAPTIKVPPALLVATVMGLIVPAPWLVTHAVLPSGVIVILKGLVNPPIVFVALVASVITVTVPEVMLAT